MNAQGVLTLPRLLVLSGHPVPTIAVTAMTTALAAGAGNDVATSCLVAVAVLSGQLSIGWSNDVIDARRDRAVGRPDKPVATGLIPARTVVAAVVLALLVTTTGSVLVGWRAGLAQLTLVGSGWIYNVALKGTLWSWVPFVTGFGAVPAVAALALPEHPWPGWWSLVAGGLIGVAAHLGNVLPDLADDDATGVRGLPHRLGAGTTAVGALVAAWTAVAVVVLGPAGEPSAAGLIGMLAAGTVALAGLAVVRRVPSSEAAFLATMAIAAIGVALLAGSSSFP